MGEVLANLELVFVVLSPSFGARSEGPDELDREAVKAGILTTPGFGDDVELPSTVGEAPITTEAGMIPGQLFRAFTPILLAQCLLVTAATAQPPAYGYLTQWGTLGNGPGQFDQPQGAAVDGTVTFTSRILTITGSRSLRPMGSS